MIMTLINFNGAQRFLFIVAILSTAFTKPPILCMTKPFGFRTNGHGSVSPSSASNLPHDSMPTMELTMKRFDKGATFGDQGHVLTAPRRFSCYSFSACHLLRTEAPVGGVAQKTKKTKKTKHTMIMKRLDEGATFGDQGHVLTAPRKLSRHSSSAYHAHFFAELLLLILLVSYFRSVMRRRRQRQNNIGRVRRDDHGERRGQVYQRAFDMILCTTNVREVGGRVGRAFFLCALRSIPIVDYWRNAATCITEFLKAFALEKIAVSFLLSRIKCLWDKSTIPSVGDFSFQKASLFLTTNFLDFILEKIALCILLSGVDFLCPKLTFFIFQV
jgi:hypothetical protein